MKRYLLRKGDKTTAEGIVLEGMSNCTVYGIELTYVGALIWCPACKTNGRIGAQGPRWKSSMRGKEQALDGDLCLCECVPHPTVQASQTQASQSFNAELLVQGLAQGGHNPYGAPLHYDECVRLRNRRTGKPLANMRYRVLCDGQLVAGGRTDAGGLTERIATSRAGILEIQVREE